MTKPERLDRFMVRANAIYYGTHDPFADFTTSPEISQVFGEIVGLWAAVSWGLLGCPGSVSLVEAGPGRGTLMADALRAVRLAAPDFAGALRVRFIETSARLRGVQAGRVPDASWHDDLGGVPDGPMILLGNEFLDALPIRQFVRRGDGWTERFVEAGQWVEVSVAADEVPSGRVVGEGDVVEVNEAARDFVAAVVRRLERCPGAALFLDYGPAGSAAGDSLQALAGKRPVDPLVHAGSADLTAHVDFSDLALVAREAGALVQGPVPQGSFLGALGVFQRTERLVLGRPAEQAAALIEASRRLTDFSEMGHLFKVMAVRSAGVPELPGFPP
jgi:NADH dehydrogenase [ubiquinone] 1 alpha subcomplex assembly factor 7